jgi:hypothetical protein
MTRGKARTEVSRDAKSVVGRGVAVPKSEQKAADVMSHNIVGVYSQRLCDRRFGLGNRRLWILAPAHQD